MRGLSWRALPVLVLAKTVAAGFMAVSVNSTVQCQNATVTWSGDDGPWHLLLTPTDFAMHSYNLWVPEIPVTAKNYTIPMNQPAGTTFLITMWGASGIRYAGTTDVMSVARPSPANNATCFLTDDQILALYSFSFNISDTSGLYPPECSNLSMTWPSSLENNINPAKRDVVHNLASRQTAPVADNPSSSDRKGNTTNPPTMFGIIPLGNSFSIPVTYPTAYSDHLPSSAISNTPTTWTKQGVTHLNWTIGLSKGTRFILVAGIGDQMQWASGGSSRMLTVGQGTGECYGFGEVTDVPSITGPSTATQTLSAPIDESSTGSTTSRLGVTATTIVSVLSVLVTLVLVGICFCCFRIRRRRRKAAQITAFNDAKPLGSYKRRSDEGSEGHRLDIISPPSSERRPTPIDTSFNTLNSTFQESPSRSSPHPSAIQSPMDRVRAVSSMGRQSSQEYLLSPSRNSSLLPQPQGYSEPGDGDVTDLKLETIAQFDRDGNRSGGPSRRRMEDEEVDYVVHRDAGRVRELPPRYDEVKWEEEERRP